MAKSKKPTAPESRILKHPSGVIAKKKKVEMQDLGKVHIKENLKRIHKFLNKDFRILEANELNSEEVFKELFPGEKIELYKLRAIYEMQK